VVGVALALVGGGNRRRERERELVGPPTGLGPWLRVGPARAGQGEKGERERAGLPALLERPRKEREKRRAAGLPASLDQAKRGRVKKVFLFYFLKRIKC
jgi:hypothetical protein